MSLRSQWIASVLSLCVGFCGRTMNFENSFARYDASILFLEAYALISFKWNSRQMRLALGNNGHTISNETTKNSSLTDFWPEAFHAMF